MFSNYYYYATNITQNNYSVNPKLVLNKTLHMIFLNFVITSAFHWHRLHKQNYHRSRRAFLIPYLYIYFHSNVCPPRLTISFSLNGVSGFLSGFDFSANTKPDTRNRLMMWYFPRGILILIFVALFVFFSGLRADLLLVDRWHPIVWCQPISLDPCFTGTDFDSLQLFLIWKSSTHTRAPQS